jgi:hypothetical protein
MQRIASEEGLEVLQPELGTKPRVYYKNKHLFDSCFVSGSVVETIDGVEECAAGAQVILKHGGDEVGRATTDTFGEFKIDRLAPNSGEYELEISHGPSGSVATSFGLAEQSLYLGVLKLQA